MSALNSVNLILISTDEGIVSFTIDSDYAALTYEIYIKKNSETVFTLFDTIVEKYGILQIPGLINAELKVVAKDSFGDTMGTAISNKIFSSNGSGMVTVFGNIKDVQTRNISEVVINVTLRPDEKDYEILGSVILSGVDQFVCSNSDGYWSVNLFPNKSSDGNCISDRGTFYDFDFLGKNFKREINLDNGPSQSFFSLLEPEKERVRRDSYEWSI